MQKLKFNINSVDYTLSFYAVADSMYKTTLLRGDDVVSYDVTDSQYQTPWLALDRLLSSSIDKLRYTRGEYSESLYKRIEELKNVIDGLTDADVRHKVIKTQEFTK